MDKNPFQEKLIELQGNLYNFAFKLTCNKEDASDLLQETSLKVLDSESKYTEKENFQGWSFIIMRNIFINNYRKLVKSREQESAESLDFKQTMEISDDSPEDALNAKEINNIINSFAVELRTPISMYMTGYSYQEISEILSLPLGTIKSRIFIARKGLQSKLKDYRC